MRNNNNNKKDKTFAIAITKARVQSISLTSEQISASVELLAGNEKVITTVCFSSELYYKQIGKFIPYDPWVKDLFHKIADSVAASSELSLERMCNMLGEPTESEEIK